MGGPGTEGERSPIVLANGNLGENQSVVNGNRYSTSAPIVSSVHTRAVYTRCSEIANSCFHYSRSGPFLVGSSVSLYSGVVLASDRRVSRVDGASSIATMTYARRSCDACTGCLWFTRSRGVYGLIGAGVLLWIDGVNGFDGFSWSLDLFVFVESRMNRGCVAGEILLEEHRCEGFFCFACLLFGNDRRRNLPRTARVRSAPRLENVLCEMYGLRGRRFVMKIKRNMRWL